MWWKKLWGGVGSGIGRLGLVLDPEQGLCRCHHWQTYAAMSLQITRNIFRSQQTRHTHCHSRTRANQQMHIHTEQSNVNHMSVNSYLGIFTSLFQRCRPERSSFCHLPVNIRGLDVIRSNAKCHERVAKMLNWFNQSKDRKSSHFLRLSTHYQIPLWIFDLFRGVETSINQLEHFLEVSKATANRFYVSCRGGSVSCPSFISRCIYTRKYSFQYWNQIKHVSMCLFQLFSIVFPGILSHRDRNIIRDQLQVQMLKFWDLPCGSR